jgi:hypothetical protein
MTYAQLLEFLCSLCDRDLAKPVQVLIADQVIPFSGIHECANEDTPMLDTGHWAGVPAGRA